MRCFSQQCADHLCQTFAFAVIGLIPTQADPANAQVVRGGFIRQNRREFRADG